MLLILGGTTDCHKYINENKPERYVITVATEYGYELYEKIYGNNVIFKRFDTESLSTFIKENGVTTVVDTTHPFAEVITKNAKDVCSNLFIPYINAKREIILTESDDNIIVFPDFEQALEWLKNSGIKRPLFTIGSNRLHIFREILDNAVVRVLDDEKSVSVCRSLGIPDDLIVAARGPFTIKDNIDLIEKYTVDCLITKNSGKTGGVDTKILAAKQLNIPVVIINPVDV